MATLLLRIAAPLQSWGCSSKFEIRETNREPSKSGVIGLVAAALGRGRTESVEDLVRLRFGVRVDQEGELLRDFHMVHGEKNSYVTNRYYLTDAIFLTGLETEDAIFLREVEEALKHPKYPLFFGRRSCPPTFPFVLGIEEKGLAEALTEYPLLVPEWSKKRSGTYRIVYDDPESGDSSSRIRDVPLSFSPLHREYGYRIVSENIYSPVQEEHDPMRELR